VYEPFADESLETRRLGGFGPKLRIAEEGQKGRRINDHAQ
jgi:hypothetical protein